MQNNEDQLLDSMVRDVRNAAAKKKKHCTFDDAANVLNKERKRASKPTNDFEQEPATMFVPSARQQTRHSKPPLGKSSSQSKVRSSEATAASSTFDLDSELDALVDVTPTLQLNPRVLQQQQHRTNDKNVVCLDIPTGAHVAMIRQWRTAVHEAANPSEAKLTWGGEDEVPTDDKTKEQRISHHPEVPPSASASARTAKEAPTICDNCDMISGFAPAFHPHQ